MRFRTGHIFLRAVDARRPRGRLCESALPAVEYCAAVTPLTRRERRGDGVWAAPDAIDATSEDATERDKKV